VLVCCHYIERLQHKPDTHCQHHCFTVCFCYIFKDARDSFCKPSDRSASTTPTKPVSNSSEYLTPVHGRALAYLHNRALDYVHGRALDYVHGRALDYVHGRALYYVHGRALDYVHGRALDYVKCSV